MRRGLQRHVVTGDHVLVEQEPDRHGLRELGRTPEPTEGAVPALQDRRCSGAQEVLVEGTSVAAPDLLHPLLDVLGDRCGALGDLLALLLPGARDSGKHVGEAGHASAAAAGPVGPGVEGPALVVEEDAHRPATPARQGLRGRHVDAVDIGPLLAVHLDVREVLVEVGRDLVVLERLVRHDVAPELGLQWQLEYPTERKIGTSLRRASSNASSPQGYQSTGLSAC